MSQSVFVQTVTIPNGGNSVSFTQPTGMSLRAIRTPVSFEGTTLTFQAGYQSPGADVYDAGSVFSLACGASRYIPITKKDLFIGPAFVRVTSNVSGSPSNVAADRTLELFFASE